MKLLMGVSDSATGDHGKGMDSPRGCVPPVNAGSHSAWIPNVTVHTHRGQTARFYDDLIARGTVLLHCISTRDEAGCRSLETMARVQDLLGEELGRTVFIYSIAADSDGSPEALRALAEKYQAGIGWSFLTGDPAELSLLRTRMFRSGGEDCSMHLIRYGNEAVGLWGGVAAHSSPESIAHRLSWVTPKDRPAGPPIRGGPFPPGPDS